MTIQAQSKPLVILYLIKVAQTRYQKWDVTCLRDGQKMFVKGLDTKGAIRICQENGTKMDVMIESTRTIQVGKMLNERCIPYEVTDKGVGLSPTASKRSFGPSCSPRIRSPLRRIQCILDWNDFYPLETVYKYLESLEILYPSICTVVDIGRSVEGRPIKMLKVSNSDARNTGAWLDGCIHAREWIACSVVTYIAHILTKNFSSLGESITNKDWYLLPIVNPDGYHFSFVGDRMWRKNRARFGNVITGVDLNRNFSNNWGRTSFDNISNGDPTHLNYRGPSPFSEPESAAIKDIILYSGTPFKIFLSFHAYSEVIAFPWCYSPDPCPDYVSLLEGATCMAKAIYKTTGRMYKVGNFKNVMYYAAGTSIDWSYNTARVPFSYLVELRSKQDKFILPKNEILDCCKEVCNGVIALAKFSDEKVCLNCTMFEKS